MNTLREQDITYEMCLAAVKHCGHALKDVPEFLMTRELCLTAVLKSPNALAHVPCEFMTYEVCMLAIKQRRSVHDEALLKFTLIM